MVWRALVSDGPTDTGPVDCPRPWVLARIARALGTRPSDIFRCRLPDRPWQVRGHEQTSHCPICWNEDLSAGRPIYLRLAWTHLLKMQCPTHNYPLMPTPPDWAIKKRDVFYATKFSDSEHATLTLIEDFASEFCATAFDGKSWPTRYNVTFEQARNALILVNYSTNNTRDFSVTKNFNDSYVLAGAIGGPRYSQHAPTRVSWDLLRAVSNPSHRRAACWLIAWQALPDLRLGQRPAGCDASLPSGRFVFKKPIRIERGRLCATPWHPDRFFSKRERPLEPPRPPNRESDSAPRSVRNTEYIGSMNGNHFERFYYPWE